MYLFSFVGGSCSMPFSYTVGEVCLTYLSSTTAQVCLVSLLSLLEKCCLEFLFSTAAFVCILFSKKSQLNSYQFIPYDGGTSVLDRQESLYKPQLGRCSPSRDSDGLVVTTSDSMSFRGIHNISFCLHFILHGSLKWMVSSLCLHIVPSWEYQLFLFACCSQWESQLKGQLFMFACWPQLNDYLFLFVCYSTQESQPNGQLKCQQLPNSTRCWIYRIKNFSVTCMFVFFFILDNNTHIFQSGYMVDK